MPTTSIGSIIRSVIEETQPMFHADDIAEKVINRIPTDSYAGYLRELISARVSSEAGYLRSKVTPKVKNMSTKQRLIRDEHWPKFLAQKIALPSGYKPLADATAEDLLFLAQSRRSQANDLLGKAQEFERLAQLMKRTGAETLGKLDPHIGENAIAA